MISKIESQKYKLKSLETNITSVKYEMKIHNYKNKFIRVKMQRKKSKKRQIKVKTLRSMIPDSNLMSCMIFEMNYLIKEKDKKLMSSTLLLSKCLSKDSRESLRKSMKIMTKNTWLRINYLMSKTD